PHGGDDLLGGTLLHPSGAAVAPDVVRQQGAMARIDHVADGRADAMVAQGRGLQPETAQELQPPGGVFLGAGSVLDLEMVAPAGEVQALIAPLGGAGGQLLEREVGPGPGEQQDGTRHHALPNKASRGAWAPGRCGLTSWSAEERRGPSPPSPPSREAPGAARWPAAPLVPKPQAAN